MKNYIQRYGLRNMIKLAINVVRTKIFFPKSRLIRFPFDIRNKRLIDLGIGLTTGIGCRIEAYPLYNKTKIIKLGNNIEINDYVHIAGIQSISVGNNVLIASKVFISDIQHGCYSGETQHDSPNSVPKERKLSSDPVVIEDNVWIGEGVTILKGVTIGMGSIIGANSVVTKSIPKHTIAIGNPAKPIKTFNEKSNKWE